MPDVATVEIEGLDRLLRKLDVKRFAGALQATTQACLTTLLHGVATYPPETEANVPKAVGRWYQRGFGTKYRTKAGKLHEYKTSEVLGKSWNIRVTGTLSGDVGSKVSYGPYVQGAKQAEFHKDRGWKTIWQVTAEKAKEIEKKVYIAVDRLLGGP